jgi:sugar phosphate isomerase/epimerase
MWSLDIDDIERDSTHCGRPDLLEIVKREARGVLLPHNSFPPAENHLVLNIASADDTIRAASFEYARMVMGFAAKVGGELYTIHPGFISDAEIPAASANPATPYDFAFPQARAE